MGEGGGVWGGGGGKPVAPGSIKLEENRPPSVVSPATIEDPDNNWQVGECCRWIPVSWGGNRYFPSNCQSRREGRGGVVFFMLSIKIGFGYLLPHQRGCQ